MEITDLSGYTVLSNKVKMPYFGLGVFRMKEGDEVINAVSYALKAGYRHIDTASMYNNEKGVGIAIAESKIKREEIFVTTKIWNSNQGYDSALKAFDNSLQKLGTTYINLYLIHWPVKGKFNETWRAMETLYKQGLIKAIGVSNFLVHHLKDLFKTAEILPMVNQMEFHPYLVQQDLIDFCKNSHIQYEAWSPLMQGRIDSVEPIRKLADKYSKTPAQIVLRWNLQKDVVTIPKSVTPERILSNSRIFDFSLTGDEIRYIDSLDKGFRYGADPDTFDF